MDRSDKQTILCSNKSWGSVPVYGDVQWTRTSEPYDYPKRDSRRKRNRHNKYFLAIKTICLSVLSVSVTAPAHADVGGVSATASPVANSSGSVTNQAIQVLQGPYITNTYGNGIQCQGPTMNFTPYVTGSASATKPYEPYYFDPVYDMRDNTGAFDDDGNAIGDGAPDNPGSILYRVPVRTGQKDNYNLGVGFSMTWSKPLDKELQAKCKEAATANIEMMRQLTANKRLDFEIGRLKNCGELLKQGIQFHPRSPYYSVCADVVVNNPPGHTHPHYHVIPSSSSSGTQNEEHESQHSSDADHLGAPLQIEQESSSPE